jgi:hypothetical protein
MENLEKIIKKKKIELFNKLNSQLIYDFSPI